MTLTFWLKYWYGNDAKFSDRQVWAKSVDPDQPILKYWYGNDLKFLDRQVWANSVDPDQPAPEVTVWSGSTLFDILYASFDALLYGINHVD